MQRILLVAFLMLAGGAASAQQTFSEVQRAAMAQQSAATPVRVNVSINIFVLAPAGMGDQAMAEQEKARRQIYQLATKECAVILDTIASDCRIETVNVNVHRHQGQQPVEGFQVGANMNFRVTLK